MYIQDIKIVNSTGNTILDLMGDNYYIFDWTPQISVYKDSGIYQSTVLQDFKYPMILTYDNVIEEFSIAVHGSTQSQTINAINKLASLLSNLPAPWIKNYRTRYYLAVKLPDESSYRYAPLVTGRLEDLTGLTGDHFESGFNISTVGNRFGLVRLKMFLERYDWVTTITGTTMTPQSVYKIYNLYQDFILDAGWPSSVVAPKIAVPAGASTNYDEPLDMMFQWANCKDVWHTGNANPELGRYRYGTRHNASGDYVGSGIVQKWYPGNNNYITIFEGKTIDNPGVYYPITQINPVFGTSSTYWQNISFANVYGIYTSTVSDQTYTGSNWTTSLTYSNANIQAYTFINRGTGDYWIANRYGLKRDGTAGGDWLHFYDSTDGPTTITTGLIPTNYTGTIQRVELIETSATYPQLLAVFTDTKIWLYSLDPNGPSGHTFGDDPTFIGSYEYVNKELELTMPFRGQTDGYVSYHTAWVTAKQAWLFDYDWWGDIHNITDRLQPLSDFQYMVHAITIDKTLGVVVIDESVNKLNPSIYVDWYEYKFKNYDQYDTSSVKFLGRVKLAAPYYQSSNVLLEELYKYRFEWSGHWQTGTNIDAGRDSFNILSRGHTWKFENNDPKQFAPVRPDYEPQTVVANSYTSGSRIRYYYHEYALDGTTFSTKEWYHAERNDDIADANQMLWDAEFTMDMSFGNNAQATHNYYFGGDEKFTSVAMEYIEDAREILMNGTWYYWTSSGGGAWEQLYSLKQNFFDGEDFGDGIRYIALDNIDEETDPWATTTVNSQTAYWVKCKYGPATSYVNTTQSVKARRYAFELTGDNLELSYPSTNASNKVNLEFVFSELSGEIDTKAPHKVLIAGSKDKPSNFTPFLPPYSEHGNYTIDTNGTVTVHNKLNGANLYGSSFSARYAQITLTYSDGAIPGTPSVEYICDYDWMASYKGKFRVFAKVRPVFTVEEESPEYYSFAVKIHNYTISRQEALWESEEITLPDWIAGNHNCPTFDLGYVTLGSEFTEYGSASIAIYTWLNTDPSTTYDVVFEELIFMPIDDVFIEAETMIQTKNTNWLDQHKIVISSIEEHKNGVLAYRSPTEMRMDGSNNSPAYMSVFSKTNNFEIETNSTYKFWTLFFNIVADTAAEIGIPENPIRYSSSKYYLTHDPWSAFKLQIKAQPKTRLLS